MSAGAKKLAQYPDTHRGDIEIEERPESEGKRQVSRCPKQPSVDKSTRRARCLGATQRDGRERPAKPQNIPTMIDAPTFPPDPCTTTI